MFYIYNLLKNSENKPSQRRDGRGKMTARNDVNGLARK